jgi:hypothetical protein
MACKRRNFSSTLINNKVYNHNKNYRYFNPYQLQYVKSKKVIPNVIHLIMVRAVSGPQ